MAWDPSQQSVDHTGSGGLSLLERCNCDSALVGGTDAQEVPHLEGAVLDSGLANAFLAQKA